MPYRIEQRIEIAAPAWRVWETIQDPGRRLEWDERVRSSRALGDGPVGRGSRLEVVIDLWGMPVRSVIEYVTWAPPRRSGVKSVSTDVFRSEVAGSWHFDESPAGTTVWTTRISIRSRLPLAGRLVERWLGRIFDRLTLRSQANLKRLVESEAVTVAGR